MRKSRRKTCDYLKKFVPDKGSIVLIYGERGVGKTVFLTNLFHCFLKYSNYTVIYITRKSLGITKQLNELLNGTLNDSLEKNVFLCDFSDFVNKKNCSIFLKEKLFHYFFLELPKKVTSGNSRVIVILDDILDFITSVNLKKFSFLGSLLLLGRRLNSIIFVSVSESLSYPLPSKESASLLWIADYILRIKKIRKLREIYRFDLSDISIHDFSEGIGYLLDKLNGKMTYKAQFFISSNGHLKFVKKKRNNYTLKKSESI